VGEPPHLHPSGPGIVKYRFAPTQGPGRYRPPHAKAAMTPVAAHLLWLLLAWSAYCALHSALAAERWKAWLASRAPRLMPRYRLVYNVLAVALLLPPLGLMARWGGEPLWRWPGAWRWAADGLALLAGAGFLLTLRHYDMAAFLGWAPAGAGTAERLTLSPLHRWVRHPWYALALVMIWTREPDAAFLVSALVWSAYFALGARLEERRLVAAHGEAYRRYQARVPALLPRPWRRLTAAEAAAIGALARPAPSGSPTPTQGDA